LGKWHDLFFGVVSTTIVFVGGCYLAYYFKPIWLNRAGSLIIIIGVILAVNRIHEIYEKRFIGIFDKSNENEFIETIEKKLDRPVTPEERRDFKEMVRSELVSHLKAITTERKRVFRYFEVWLIIFGTFLNGFGDFFVCMLRSCNS
jgi:hypothetical protein